MSMGTKLDTQDRDVMCWANFIELYRNYRNSKPCCPTRYFAEMIRRNRLSLDRTIRSGRGSIECDLDKLLAELDGDVK